jgi:FkbM family methyltransferase
MQTKNRPWTKDFNIWHRPGTQDMHVWQGVLVKNEYRLPDSFNPTDRIIDIGAHIGVFAVACVARGAGRVECYEPDQDNFDLLRENLKGVDGVYPFHMAVHESGHPVRAMVFSGYNPGYNACGYMIQEMANETEPYAYTTGLDSIIAGQPVRLLKLDCEGAEFPILLTATKLHLVQEIVGEMHAMTYESQDRGNLTPCDLADFLTEVGFTVQMWKPEFKGRSQTCNFSAKR